MRIIVTIFLVLGCLNASFAQNLEKTCLQETDEGDGLALVVDGLGTIHLSRAVRLTGALNYTRVDVDGSVTTEQLVSRISRIPTTQTLATGIARLNDTLFICFQDKLARRLRVAAGNAGNWSISTVEDGVTGDGCAIAVLNGRVHVVYEKQQTLRHGESNGFGPWTLRVADDGGGLDVGALASLGVTTAGVLAAAHRDETAQTLRISRWDGNQWATSVPSSPIFQPGLRPVIVGSDAGRIRVFHGTGLGNPSESDGALLETEGAVAGPFNTGALPDFSTGGYTGAAHGSRGTFVVTRRYSRSALFGDSDGLFLYRGDPLESLSLEQYGGADIRHTFKHIQVALDPFGLPVVAYVDEFAGRPGIPGGAPVCYWRPVDSDGDRIPDEIEDELGTDPGLADTDGDGRDDGQEVLIDGTDPTMGDGCNPQPESCNNVDDDCDGRIDESLSRACYDGPGGTAGNGSCRSGSQTCAAGQWSQCAGQILPGVESCNGSDDDCDNRIDENTSPVNQACDTGLSGVCSAGLVICFNGVLLCVGQVESQPESCNGLDDDCDGPIDEGEQSCGTGVCARTVPLCSGNQSNICTPGGAQGDDALCDGVDEDCDGRVDENFIPNETACGRGACASTGVTSCVGGVLNDSCVAGNGQADDNCDGIDNDCDGRIDEGFVSQATACGIGVCAATGQTQCQNGQLSDSCSPKNAGPRDRSCDGLDDDCDGRFDEDFIEVEVECGDGACRTTGARTCVAGQLVDECAPLGAGNDDNCDGVDDDCDGRIDEGFAVSPVQCGVGACASTGTRTCVAGVITEQCTPQIPVGNDVTCDGIDDDCDANIDEAYESRDTSCGLGPCQRAGQTECVNGAETDTCQPAQPAPNDGVCDGVDDDCDGQADEDYVRQEVVCGVGACQASVFTLCQNGEVVDSCAPGQGADSDQTCDGIDDDCDQRVDENFQGPVTECGVGACRRQGQLLCLGGNLRDGCVPGQPSATDATCDGLDDDCDGRFDEDYAPEPVQCGQGQCQNTGSEECIDGQVTTVCQPLQPAADDSVCDGLDSDCDGQLDEDVPETPTLCGIGACERQGSVRCVGGQFNTQCTPGDGQGTDDACDGVDDDCDGRIDERFIGQVIACGVGACVAQSQQVCVNGEIQDTCVPLAGRDGPDICDGADSDCDGRVDEDHQSQPTSCGVGACTAQGQELCVEGRPVNSCTPLAPALNDASCDGVDDDCDGWADENYARQDVTCGQGVCQRDGVRVCRQGEERTFCTPGSTTGGDNDCDGIDDDCDGRVDEHFVVIDTQCGQGACQASGQRLCQGGQLVDTCQAPLPSGAPDLCDGIDDDCDGRVDEAHIDSVSTCGQGVCASQGRNVCQGGVVVDSCTEGNPQGADDQCDGLDNDCDGQADEGYNPVPTTCGLGVCVADGEWTCRSGVLVDSCRPKARESAFDRCDNRDEDCDGQLDEDHMAAPTRCGVGECQQTGRLNCVEGVVTDTCTPSLPLGRDSSCDGRDQDCDGRNDEFFFERDTECGSGLCARNGRLTCVNGNTVDSCVEGPRQGPDDDCDGQDQDCDGQTDESYDEPVTRCGQGQCARFGRLTCDGGQTVDSCRAGTPDDADLLCDGLDQDCDGRFDEDFGTQETTCGEGICADRGEQFCLDGSVTDSCAPGNPIGDDANCDGIDDDCDGKVDEGAREERIQCGTGACSTFGVRRCVDGAYIDGCVPLEPTGTDVTCDGVDDDCDGRVDEAYRQQSVSCGVGGCQVSGVTRCRGGRVVDVCNPGVASPSDVNCDGVDNDCDGKTDEDFMGQPTTCGFGVCERAGAEICVDGKLSKACTPGEPVDDDRTCDGRDTDCDGRVDEAYVGLVVECGIGPCAVAQRGTCIDGRVDNRCTPKPPSGPDDTCDGVDDDCDGRPDESAFPRRFFCGAGACRSEGLERCYQGEWLDRCTPGEPAPNDLTCDGVDDDCDDLVDEDCRLDGGVLPPDSGVDSDAGVAPVMGGQSANGAGRAAGGQISGGQATMGGQSVSGGQVGGRPAGGAEMGGQSGEPSGGLSVEPGGGGVTGPSSGGETITVAPTAGRGVSPDEPQAGGDPLAGGIMGNFAGQTTSRPDGCVEGQDCPEIPAVEMGRSVKEGCDCSTQSSNPSSWFFWLLVTFCLRGRRRRLI